MSEPPKRRSFSPSAKPHEYGVPSQSQLPGADYSYTVELVGTIQHQLGKLTEALDSLKEQSKEHGTELKAIGKDIHAVKVVGAF